MSNADKVNAKHRFAMELLDYVDIIRNKGHLTYGHGDILERRAAELEREAAEETPKDVEPTRSILYRGAAVLRLRSAKNTDEMKEAWNLAKDGLAGNPGPTNLQISTK
jgi:hypothetical protein